MDSLRLRYDDTLTSKLVNCKQCGKCCDGTIFTNVALTKEDIARLEDGLGKPFTDIFTTEEIICLNTDGKSRLSFAFPCKFLKDNKCTIYNLRPLACRQYPIYCGEGIIKVDEINCPAGKELYEEKKKQYPPISLDRTAISPLLKEDPLIDMKVVDTQIKGEDVDWKKLFLFNDKLYNYYFAAYNNTILNEREIEIPIIADYLSKNPAENILEIGNVLSHYFANVQHDVLDRDEKGDNVINKDIVTYTSKKKYNLIVSISTMEHVGMEGDGVYKLIRGEVEKGFNSVQNLLARKGKFIFTVPLYFNPEMDELIRSGLLSFDETYCMERSMTDHTWTQVDFSEVKKLPWNNFVQNVVDAEEQVYALRRMRYLLVGIINQGGG